MANIGKLNIKIVADPTEVKAGLAETAQAVTNFADTAAGKFLGVSKAMADIEKVWSGVSGFFSDTIGSISSAFEGFFKDGLYGIVKSAAGMIIETIGSAISYVINQVTKFHDKLMQKWEDLGPAIADSFKNAQRVGASTGDLMGLEKLGFETTLLAKFRLNDPTGNLVEGIAKVADQMKALESPADRARLAMDKFGKVGFVQIPILQKGGEFIRERIQQMREMGMILTDQEASAVAKARKAAKDMKLVWEGFWNKMVVAIAPAMEAISKWFLAMAPHIARFAEGLGIVIGEASKAAVVIGSLLLDAVLGLGTSFLGLDKDGTAAFKSMDEWAKKLRDGVWELAGVFGDLFDRITIGLGTTLKYLGMALDKAGRIEGYAPTSFFGMSFDLLLYNANEKVDTLGAKLQQLAKRMEATEVGTSRKAIERRRKEFEDALAKARGLDLAGQKDQQAPFQYSPASVMERGSKEAMSILARWRTEQMANPQLKEQQRTNEILERIERNTKGLPLPGGVPQFDFGELEF